VKARLWFFRTVFALFVLLAVVAAARAYLHVRDPWRGTELERVEELTASGEIIGLPESATERLLGTPDHRMSDVDELEQESAPYAQELLATVSEETSPTAVWLYYLGTARTGLDDAYLVVIYDLHRRVVAAEIVVQ